MIEIFNEDCMDVLNRCPDKTFNLIIQDMPYNTTQNDWDIKVDLDKLWPEWIRVSKPNAAIIFTAAQPFTTDLINSNREMFRYDLIWYKPLGSGHLNASKMPMRNHEHILVFYQKPPVYNPIMGEGLRKKGIRKSGRNGSNYGKFAIEEDQFFDDKGRRFPQSVIEVTNGDRTKENDHPTQKPLDLFRYLIRTYSNADDNVFDGYSGSGTTPVACAIEGRNCVACEKDTNHGYFKRSIERLRLIQLQPQFKFY